MQQVRVEASTAALTGLRRAERLPAELENERELIRRCQEGDLSAYEVVYRRHHQALLRVAVRMLGQREDAEDAVQTAFIRLHRSIHKYRFEASFGTYLMRIAINCCYDALAARSRDKREQIDAVETVQPYTADLRLQLEQAISVLPERMRACFVLFAVEGFPQREVADMMDVSIGTVKAHISQAKERLRSLLSDSSEETTT